MHKNATKCNKTLRKWCKNKHGASKIIDTFETYQWTMYFDGSKRFQGAGAGVVLISPQGDKLKYVLRMSFPQASNNEAEYEALLHGMKRAKACGATRLKIFGDSNLVVQQVMNRCDTISDNMTAYKNLYYYLEEHSMDAKSRTGPAIRKPTI
jgi:ribonuclease HI